MLGQTNTRPSGGIGWSRWVTGIGVLFAVAYLLSGMYVLRSRVVRGSTDTEINVTRGCVEVLQRALSPSEVSQYLFVCRSKVPIGWDLWGWRNDEFVTGFGIYRVPCWPLILVTLPAHFVVSCYRTRKRGQCGKCGYQRAGLPVGAACPECGSLPRPVVLTAKN